LVFYLLKFSPSILLLPFSGITVSSSEEADI
jgi:hypothetical protein